MLRLFAEVTQGVRTSQGQSLRLPDGLLVPKRALHQKAVELDASHSVSDRTVDIQNLGNLVRGGAEKASCKGSLPPWKKWEKRETLRRRSKRKT